MLSEQRAIVSPCFGLVRFLFGPPTVKLVAIRQDEPGVRDRLIVEPPAPTAPRVPWPNVGNAVAQKALAWSFQEPECMTVRLPETEEVLTTKEVSQILKVPVFRVQELARQRLLPCVHLGRQLRFQTSKIKAYMESGGQSLPGGWRREAQ
jgi:excisionase family DNA binding protein